MKQGFHYLEMLIIPSTGTDVLESSPSFLVPRTLIYETTPASLAAGRHRSPEKWVSAISKML
jgi:hypothetical protein